MARRRYLQVTLALLAAFLLGTVIVLSTVSFYLQIDNRAFLTPEELELDIANNQSRPELIPRILHQTWKTDVLPEKWQGVSANCREIMPTYEYKLWTDKTSRQFIMDNYPWFLTTFDGYPYPIQRADAIRYFILHHYGGIYLDLDIGCNKPLDPLLTYSVLLPKTIPVGVSNDLMFAAPRHPFLDQTIHNLVTFDHSWMLNYPTVMFSTGPMFLSAQYGLYASKHSTENDIRILPKSLYGKNAKPGEAPNAYFTHYYGSSWHADDAGFITFLGKWGTILMYVGGVVLLGGIVRLIYTRGHRSAKSHTVARRRLLMGRYDIILPRVAHRNGGFHFDLGSFSLASASNTQPSSPVSTSPTSSAPSSPTLPLLPMFDNDAPTSPPPTAPAGWESGVAKALRSAGAWMRGKQPSKRALRSRRSTLFFLPAIFTPSSSNSGVRLHEADRSRRRQSDDVEMPFLPTPNKRSLADQLDFDESHLDRPQASRQPLLESDEEQDIALRPSSSTPSLSQSPLPPSSFGLSRGSPVPAPLDLSAPGSVPHPTTPRSFSAQGHGISTPQPGSAWSTAWGEWEGEESPLSAAGGRGMMSPMPKGPLSSEGKEGSS